MPFFLVVSLVSPILAVKYAFNHHKDIFSFNLVDLGSSVLSIDVIFDGYSTTFASLVCFIALGVIFFSLDYMKGEKNQVRFYFLFFFFIFSMLTLIFIPHLPGLFLGWDLLGMSSFLLVSFYKSSSASKGAMLTALTSRIGDAFLLIFLTFCSLTYGSVDPAFLSAKSIPVIVVFCIILAAMTKSAQTPFSGWLPAAMAAPTPVSALVHSSTLVTAGVYMLIQNFSVVLPICWLLLGIGGITMVLPGLMALFETDLKRVVALSTLSQLGLMFFYLGAGFKELAFAHMASHAVVKALLFVSVGMVIYASCHCQDISFLGGRLNSMPMAQVGFLVSLLGLVGFPFVGCYYSKHALISGLSSGVFSAGVLLVLYIGFFFTVAYSTRLLSVMVLLSSAKATHPTVEYKSFSWWSSLSVFMLMFGLAVLPFIIYPLSGVNTGLEIKASNNCSYNMTNSWMVFGAFIGWLAPRISPHSPDLFMSGWNDLAKEKIGDHSKNISERCDSGWWEMYSVLGFYNVFLKDLWQLEIKVYEKFKSSVLEKDSSFYPWMVSKIDSMIEKSWGFFYFMVWLLCVVMWVMFMIWLFSL
ncbi:NADH dehydrogenase subunit 5 (mitochondrion) [Lingula anatina]|uniref:NADH-ubiquinone oxidoreductase chain 5 n=1 Tax=Lingula anatina TaxID=7574 RepID=A0A2H4H0Y2_LINAN|nr:NADH dehydrogenase subunit 5 [Lingula anatina]ARH11232.1 NADH dehydrogenase subunit 5 [Lingula anatina]|eukprot:YP_009450471.1 NADH dehydrogenase subunit 5 (mitochondrion) [Lingula anatina]